MNVTWGEKAGLARLTPDFGSHLGRIASGGRIPCDRPSSVQSSRLSHRAELFRLHLAAALYSALQSVAMRLVATVIGAGEVGKQGTRRRPARANLKQAAEDQLSPFRRIASLRAFLTLSRSLAYGRPTLME